jgi:hypothetical protein
LADRYNSKASALFGTWAKLLAGGEEIGEVRTFGIGDGVDAVFFVHPTTAFASPSGVSTAVDARRGTP